MTRRRTEDRFGTPRAGLTLIRLAFSVSVGNALRGLAWVLCGKRVRGWNMIYHSASLHPAYYQCWLAKAEPRIVLRFCAERRAVSRSISVGCIILASEGRGGRDTLESVRRGLGSTTPVWTDIAALGGEDVVVIGDDVPVDRFLARIDPRIDWLLPLHAGDTVSSSLGAVLAHAAPDPSTDTVFFWDEDRYRNGRRLDPWIKPDWDPMLFDAANGIVGAALIPVAVMRVEAAAHRCAFDQGGMTALVGRVLARDGAAPIHLPLILTHRHDDTNLFPALRRPHDQVPSIADTTVPSASPSVSIIIPVRDRADLLRLCLAGLRRLTYPGQVNITIVDNDSREAETHALLAELEREDAVRVIPYPGAFNFAAMINHAVENTSGEVLCLLNNDVEPCDGAWLTAMVRHAVRETVGAVGARLLYPDGTIQHAGVAVGVGGAAGHVQKGADPDDPRFAAWHARSRIVSAVTAACLVIERSKFLVVGGMDAATFAIDFNDVDLCLNLAAQGWHNVLVVEATLIHYESQSRGTRRQPGDAARFTRELEALQTRWRTRTCRDAHHSPRFRREAERCILAF